MRSTTLLGKRRCAPRRARAIAHHSQEGLPWNISQRLLYPWSVDQHKPSMNFLLSLGMIIGLIVKYAGAGPTARGIRVSLKNVTSAPQTLWVTLGNSANFSYNLKGMLRTVTTKAGSELEDMVSR